MESVNYIVTAKHFAQHEKTGSVKERIQKRCAALHISCKNMDNPNGAPVEAQIDFGRWIAICSCGGAEAVDPDEPIFFCFSCGNRRNEGNARPVIFPDPETRTQIENIVLARPVDDEQGITDLERAYKAKPLVSTPKGTLSRSWLPNESVSDLISQNEEGGIV